MQKAKFIPHVAHHIMGFPETARRREISPNFSLPSPPASQHLSGEVNTEPHRNILEIVAELHRRGYELLRIALELSPSGCWSCSIAPAMNISATNGAMLLEWGSLAAHYSEAQGADYFDWADAADDNVAKLTDKLIERFPAMASRC